MNNDETKQGSDEETQAPAQEAAPSEASTEQEETPAN